MHVPQATLTQARLSRKTAVSWDADAMVVSHFPYGPTAYFSLHNVVLRHDIPDRGTVSEQYPHMIFDGFSSRLGERVRDPRSRVGTRTHKARWDANRARVRWRVRTIARSDAGHECPQVLVPSAQGGQQARDDVRQYEGLYLVPVRWRRDRAVNRSRNARSLTSLPRDPARV